MPQASSPSPGTRSSAGVITLVLVALIAGAAGGVTLVHFRPDLVAQFLPAPAATGTDAAASAEAAPQADGLAEPDENGRPVLYWYDPMKPEAHFMHPGPSPFMDMDLVPKYADEGAGDDSGAVKIDPTVVANLGVRTAIAEEGRLTLEVRLPAEVTLNESAVAVIQARTSGFVEEIPPRAVGDFVKKGDPLAVLTLPGWSEAQAEYLVLSSVPGTNRATLESTLRRLRLAGMPEEDIREMIRTRRVKTRFTVRAPIDGVVTTISVRRGMNISTSDTIARIEALDPVWVVASVPERYAALLKEHSEDVQTTLAVDAFPGREWTPVSREILPTGDSGTRTVRIRLTLANADGALRPGMSARLDLRAPGAEGVLLPSQAVITDGRLPRVILRRDGKFYPTPVAIAGEAGDMTAISTGVFPGDEAVLSGIFLIDAEASISGALARLTPAEPLDNGWTEATEEMNAADGAAPGSDGMAPMDHGAHEALTTPEHDQGAMPQEEKEAP
ncbi:efflux RND transporter periplasmic adaptor subunit [Sutterella sp.]|uniref:efflux RND transporter periplasmic adaptor subunit n=1 Tax=Sutterella sp. TaxID=1981025 RepID=UPI0026DFDB7E|nr:efflux RND transporter periplasmic adaptor subunit [Sutterella sp.]MDO5531461.1 efflux RND transporter periplasmic adaptor subunit [Sutterella sp.]